MAEAHLDLKLKCQKADESPMDKGQIRILVVDDDPTLSHAIEEALKRAGYAARRAGNYNEAKAAAQVTDFHGLVIDCMLPQKNGVDLSLELRTESQEDMVVVLTSGIYKDKSFSKDALAKAKAKHFLFKPFDIEALIQIFDEAFASLLDKTSEPIYGLLAKRDFSVQDRIRAVQRTTRIHGFDLPLVYSVLAKPGIQGELEITTDEKIKSIVGFSDGRIVKVQHHDQDSYFGMILVEKGFATLEAVEESLAGDSGKRIGERLVDSSSISPHAVEIVQLEQMNIRISKTIRDTSLDISFREVEMPDGIAIDPAPLSRLLGDWIASKISHDWLRSFYVPWLDRAMTRGPEYPKIDLLQGLPVVKPVRHLLEGGEWPYTLQDLLSGTDVDEFAVLKALHFLLLQRVFVFSPDQNTHQDWDKRLTRLQKIESTMAHQNHFEILGLSTKARGTEIQRAFQDLAKTLHPDRVPHEAPGSIHELTHKIFSRITEAYQNLNNDKRRDRYVKTLENGLAEEILRAESVFEQGLQLLETGQHREARKSFEKAMRMKGHRSDLMVYLVWAYVYDKRNKVPTIELYEKVRSMISQVPHEDRHSPQYFFIRGLSFGLCGDHPKALSAFKHALALDPQFAEARKEASFAKKLASRTSTTMSDDLSQVVTRFFGPRRRSG
jgi:CheY-like chemotaxis protein